MIFDHLPNIQGLIIDMDGVLWLDTQPIGDLSAIFKKIHQIGLRMILATNNATRTVEDYQEKLRGFGVEIEKSQIINSAQAAGIHLQEKFPGGASVFVVGQPSLKETLEDYGMCVVSAGFRGIDVVVASLDYQLTYDKLRQASLLIQSGSYFVGTNPDITLPTPDGLIPGSGTVIKALEIASGKHAKIIGKPEPVLYEIALRRLQCEPKQALAIGDRLDTDIAGAQAAGIHTALVLSGVSSQEQLHNYRPKPDLIAQNLAELII